MGAHAAESYEVVAPTSGLSPVIRFDWSISHIETSLGHSRYLSAVVESNAATGPQYSPAVVQASLLLLGTLSVVALATVASCWGFLRRGKRKGAHAVRFPVSSVVLGSEPSVARCGVAVCCAPIQ